jgi:hypothetical protein
MPVREVCQASEGLQNLYPAAGSVTRELKLDNYGQLPLETITLASVVPLKAMAKSLDQEPSPYPRMPPTASSASSSTE